MCGERASDVNEQAASTISGALIGPKTERRKKLTDEEVHAELETVLAALLTARAFRLHEPADHVVAMEVVFKRDGIVALRADVRRVFHDLATLRRENAELCQQFSSKEQDSV